jgi:hypothetical protein
MLKESETSDKPPGTPKRLDRLREAIRALHYSRKTEESCTHWVKRFVRGPRKRHVDGIRQSAAITSVDYSRMANAAKLSTTRSRSSFVVR